MEAAYNSISGTLNLLLYSFWFALLVFVIFVTYMTYVTIKIKEIEAKTAAKKKEYKKYYKILLYSIPVLVIIMIALYIAVF